jgi:hypothetical protein
MVVDVPQKNASIVDCEIILCGLILLYFGRGGRGRLGGGPGQGGSCDGRWAGMLMIVVLFV